MYETCYFCPGIKTKTVRFKLQRFSHVAKCSPYRLHQQFRILQNSEFYSLNIHGTELNTEQERQTDS